MPKFKLHALYKPTGDQPQEIAELVKGFKEGNQCISIFDSHAAKRRIGRKITFGN